MPDIRILMADLEKAAKSAIFPFEERSGFISEGGVGDRVFVEVIKGSAPFGESQDDDRHGTPDPPA